MTKEQVAFKFHECPDGNEMDNQGKKLISIIYHYNLYYNRLQCLFEIDQFISFSLELMIGTLMASNIEDGGKY